MFCFCLFFYTTKRDDKRLWSLFACKEGRVDDFECCPYLHLCNKMTETGEGDPRFDRRSRHDYKQLTRKCERLHRLFISGQNSSFKYHWEFCNSPQCAGWGTLIQYRFISSGVTLRSFDSVQLHAWIHWMTNGMCCMGGVQILFTLIATFCISSL